MAKSRTSRAAAVSNAPGVDEARNPLALMTRATNATRISATTAIEINGRRLIGAWPRQPTTRLLSLMPRRETLGFCPKLPLLPVHRCATRHGETVDHPLSASVAHAFDLSE